MTANVSIITLGVEDLAASTEFYVKLGWVNSSASQETVTFLQGHSVVLGLYGRGPLAEDAGVEDLVVLIRVGEEPDPRSLAQFPVDHPPDRWTFPRRRAVSSTFGGRVSRYGPKAKSGRPASRRLPPGACRLRWSTPASQNARHRDGGARRG